MEENSCSFGNTGKKELPWKIVLLSVEDERTIWNAHQEVSLRLHLQDARPIKKNRRKNFLDCGCALTLTGEHDLRDEQSFDRVTSSFCATILNTEAMW